MSDATAALGEHRRALIDSDHGATGSSGELDRDRRRAAGDVENRVRGADIEARREKRPPAWVLAKAQECRVAIVGRCDRSEELPRLMIEF